MMPSSAVQPGIFPINCTGTGDEFLMARKRLVRFVVIPILMSPAPEMKYSVHCVGSVSRDVLGRLPEKL